MITFVNKRSFILPAGTGNQARVIGNLKAHSCWEVWLFHIPRFNSVQGHLQNVKRGCLKAAPFKKSARWEKFPTHRNPDRHSRPRAVYLDSKVDDESECFSTGWGKMKALKKNELATRRVPLCPPR
jgi:hypothetical protein